MSVIKEHVVHHAPGLLSYSAAATQGVPAAVQCLSPYTNVTFPDGSLAFRIDLERMIIEIQKRGEKHYFDLHMIYQQTLDKHK